MNIRIIQLGKDKDSWLKEAIAEYQKRLRPFC
ncbi:MAG: 23S rRNA (pseudouridine(1915)-N(3))-methyltransferase RlmH, partial [Candidatus Cloacimonetes bacterium]|nr:23S rRNA (pseudouridine(1915)-N(3))-methyltransferase RlmH [Candidatus Cloacimonadota bacterium]